MRKWICNSKVPKRAYVFVGARRQFNILDLSRESGRPLDKMKADHAKFINMERITQAQVIPVKSVKLVKSVKSITAF